MNGIDWTLHELHEGERHLVRLLIAVSDRHTADHEVHFGARDLARWSVEHTRRLNEFIQDSSGATRRQEQDIEPGPVAALGEKLGHGIATALGREPKPALVLLSDLRRVHLAAVSNSLWWEMAAQAAQAAHDQKLLRLATDCHPQTLRQTRWANTLLKNLSPQALIDA